MKKNALLLILLLTVLKVETRNINGNIVNGKNETVEFATIILQTQDSVYINSVMSDSSGNFSFDEDMQNFRLVVQHLIYNSFEKAFYSGNVGTIRLEDKEYNLSEIVVKGERPVVQVIEGRITYDMQQLLQNKVVSNAYESLLQLPGVSEMNEVLTLVGASSLSVVINGKPTTMSADQLMVLLKNMPKERVKKAEVMYSAPPRYHVRGAAVNLVLTAGESDLSGLQGQVNAGYNQSYYANYNAGLTLFYESSRYSSDFMYSFGYRATHSGLDLYSHHLYQGSTYEIEQHNKSKIVKPTHNIRFGNEFNISEHNKLTLVYTGQVAPWEHSKNSSRGTYSDSKNKKLYEVPMQMHNIALNYLSGFGLDLGVDYTFYKDYTIQNYEENMPENEYSFTAKSMQDINRVSFYADRKHKPVRDMTLNYGANFIYTSNKGSQVYSSFMGKDMSSSNSNSRLREYTYNVYAGFEKSFTEKISVSGSLTGEYYKYGEFDEWSVFPSVELTYAATPSRIFQLSVSSDKNYPGYWEMMNSTTYLNGYTEIHGNPGLRPYKDYSFQLSYILKSKYIFTVYTNYKDDYFAQLPYQSAEKLTLITKTVNFDYFTTAGFNIVMPVRAGSFWDSRLVLNGFYQKAKSEHFHNTSFCKDNFAFYSGLNNTFKISSRPDIKADLTAAYITSGIQGPSKISEMYKIDAGVRWAFARNNAEIRLKVDDIFNSWFPDKWSMKQDKQNLNMHVIPDSRNISLSFTFKFGNFKERQHKNIDTSRFKQ